MVGNINGLLLEKLHSHKHKDHLKFLLEKDYLLNLKILLMKL